jgi:hypothetical protein
MPNLKPKTFDLSETSRIWIRPGEDLRLELDFFVDMSDATFHLDVEERTWSLQPVSYDAAQSTEFLTGDPEVDEGDIGTGILRINIDADTMLAWVNRTMELDLYAEEDGKRWHVVGATLTVAQGA